MKFVVLAITLLLALPVLSVEVVKRGPRSGVSFTVTGIIQNFDGSTLHGAAGRCLPMPRSSLQNDGWPCATGSAHTFPGTAFIGRVVSENAVVRRISCGYDVVGGSVTSGDSLKICPYWFGHGEDAVESLQCLTMTGSSEIAAELTGSVEVSVPNPFATSMVLVPRVAVTDSDGGITDIDGQCHMIVED